MSAENMLREAAIAAEDAAAAMYSSGTIGAAEHHEVIALAKIAEVLHGLADRRDASGFTEPADSSAMKAAHGVWISRDNATEIRSILMYSPGPQAARLENLLFEVLS